MNSPFSHGFTFVFGVVITLGLAHPPLRTWLLHKLRNTSGGGRDLLKRAVPESADELFVAGWAFASGTFFSVLLSNIGPILTGSDPWIPTLSLVACSLVVFPLTLYLRLVHKSTLPLNQPWPIIAWSHYRPLVVRLASMSRPAGRLDFVTHRGADLNDKLSSSGVIDLNYGRCIPEDAAAMIVDYEALMSIECSALLGEDVKPLRLDTLIGPTEIMQGIRNSSISRQLFQKRESSTYFPLRWGFNSLSIRANDQQLSEAIHRTFTDSPIDLFEFFTDNTHPLRSLLLKSDPKCPLLAFDWHLPAMMLLVQSACGRAAWYSTNTSSLAGRMDTLVAAVGDWLSSSALSSSLAGYCPLIGDVMQMQNTIRKTDLCVVLGGGNYLWSRSKNLTPDNVVCLPVKSDNEGYCLLWCEVLALLAPEHKHGDQDLRVDSEHLLSKVIELLPWTLQQMPFHGFLFRNEVMSTILNERESWWHKYASTHGALRNTDSHSNEYWRQVWIGIRERVINESSSLTGSTS